MEAARSLEHWYPATPLHCQNPEDLSLNLYHCEKPHILHEYRHVVYETSVCYLGHLLVDE